ncbi:TPA: hypothetical protein ACQZ9I_002523, partial [Klebsiella pneumoniae]
HLQHREASESRVSGMTAPAEKNPDGGAWRLIRATLWCRIFAGWQLRLTRPGDLALNSRPS